MYQATLLPTRDKCWADKQKEWLVSHRYLGQSEFGLDKATKLILDARDAMHEQMSKEEWEAVFQTKDP